MIATRTLGSLTATLTLTAALAGTSHAAVVLTHWYALGEDGTTPTDSIGTADFTTANGAAPTVVAGSSGAPGSTSYLLYGDGTYSSGADLSALPSDNFAVGGWFRVESLLMNIRNDVRMFSGGDASDAARASLILYDGNGGSFQDGWGGTIENRAWVGPVRGVNESAAADTWAHVAIVRDNGTSTLYIDGVAQSNPTSSEPDWFDDATLGSLGGIAGQDIATDDLRIYTFDAGEGDDALDAFFIAVPEPASVALLGVGGLLIAGRRRR